MNTVLIILAFSMIWNLIGIAAIYCYEENSDVYLYRSNGQFMPYLNPLWLWKNYKVNVIGCIILTVLFNLMCPILSVLYWGIKFIGWVCTVGRK